MKIYIFLNFYEKNKPKLNNPTPIIKTKQNHGIIALI